MFPPHHWCALGVLTTSISRARQRVGCMHVLGVTLTSRPCDMFLYERIQQDVYLWPGLVVVHVDCACLDVF